MARRLGVSREDVVAAAVLVSDRDGFDALTVAAVADEVGCRPPSVYHHVDGLDGLAGAVALVATQDLIERLRGAMAGTSGADAVRALVAEARAWGQEHPTRYDATRMKTTTEAHPDLSAARDEILLLFQDAVAGLGIPAADRPPLVSALIAATHGCISTERDAAMRGNSQLADARRAGHDLVVDLVVEHLLSVSSQSANA